MDQLDQYQISSGNQLHGLLEKPPFESMIFFGELNLYEFKGIFQACLMIQ